MTEFRNEIANMGAIAIEALKQANPEGVETELKANAAIMEAKTPAPNITWELDLVVQYTYHPYQPAYGPNLGHHDPCDEQPSSVEVWGINFRGIDIFSKFTDKEIEEMQDHILEDLETE